MPGDDDDRKMLQAIHGYCTAKEQAIDREGEGGVAATQARRRAYAAVARAARELLEEMEGGAGDSPRTP